MPPFKPVRITIFIIISPSHTLKLILCKPRPPECVECALSNGVVHLKIIPVCVAKKLISSFIPIQVARVEGLSLICDLPIRAMVSKFICKLVT